jgi:hypothetical protein
VNLPQRAVAALAAVLLPAAPLLALHFADGPPARVTGGFGEDSCAACHSGQPVNDGIGRLTLSGLPTQFVPGETYQLTLALTRPGLQAAGFQLAIRQVGDRAQAGKIAVPPEQAEIALLDERGVQFAHHSAPADPEADGEIVRWKLAWTASETAGTVVLHASAVAGDGDDSQAGDFVYTLEQSAAAR